MTFDEAVQAINSKPFDGLDEDAMKARFKELAFALHPDRAPDGRSSEAHESFQLLTELYAGAGMVGAEVDIHTKRHIYRLGDLAAKGSLANVYQGTILADPFVPVLVKMPIEPRDNDLMAAESRALKFLSEAPDAELYQWFFPTLVETFRHQDAATSIRRQVNVFEEPDDGDWYTLDAVAYEYVQRVDPKDVAWIFRRILVALGNAHSVGLVHGAVTPDNIMVLPDAHGLMLIDWCYSVSQGEPLTAVVGDFRHMYPPEALAKEPVYSHTDIFMAAQVAWALCTHNKDVPVRLRRFFTAVCSPNPKARPTNAWDLLAEFDELIEELWGPRRFHPFSMPPSAKTTTTNP